MHMHFSSNTVMMIIWRTAKDGNVRMYAKCEMKRFIIHIITDKKLG